MESDNGFASLAVESQYPYPSLGLAAKAAIVLSFVLCGMGIFVMGLACLEDSRLWARVRCYILFVSFFAENSGNRPSHFGRSSNTKWCNSFLTIRKSITNATQEQAVPSKGLRIPDAAKPHGKAHGCLWKCWASSSTSLASSTTGWMARFKQPQRALLI